jgi:hypothetical protein
MTQNGVEMASDRMTTQTITIAPASGTTTVVAATALLFVGHAATELVAAWLVTTAALLGLTGPHDGCASIKVAGAAYVGLDAGWDR